MLVRPLGITRKIYLFFSTSFNDFKYTYLVLDQFFQFIYTFANRRIGQLVID